MASKRRLRNWNPAPARTAERAQAITEPQRTAPGRKNTRDFCRGKQDVPHVPAVMFVPPVFQRARQPECEWGSRWDVEDVGWRCHHQCHCESCGKVLSTSVEREQCPAYPGSGEQHAEAIEAARIAEERWRERRAGRRKVIDGPQGYRRKKAS